MEPFVNGLKLLLESNALADFFETDFVLLRESFDEDFGSRSAFDEVAERLQDDFFFVDAGEGGALEVVDDEEERLREEDL